MAYDVLSRKANSAPCIIRTTSMETYMVRIYTGPLSHDHEFVSVESDKATIAEDIIAIAAHKLRLACPDDYEMAEVFSTAGQLCKERRLEETEKPVGIQLMWPKVINAEIDHGLGLHTGYRFYIRRKNLEILNRTSSWVEYTDPNPLDNFLTEFLRRPTSNKEYTDLCNLPDLNERTLLENLKSRFLKSNIYTYVGSILIAVNPFKFFPIYNPKYVEMYQNKRLGDLPPHIFAIADAAFHTMLRTKHNQCIVISGESGSGKTESTNLLLHHLTTLSHKGQHGSGVEQTIMGAGPVLEAFGNAKTVHNNNSSRFGKFIQVNYKENGMVHGAIVEKYLLEKSRIVSQAKNEMNYHVFYYLLAGATETERETLYLRPAEDYFYLKQSGCYVLEEVDEEKEFTRLKQSMEMVGFSQLTQKRIFAVLSVVLHLGNVKFKKKGDQHYDESVTIINPETIHVISELLHVKERTLTEALTQKRAMAGGDIVVMNNKMSDALATRDAMAKCLYGSLFDWIVLKVNQALLAKRHNSEHQGNSIGVLDIFGFEDFQRNSFEQFCINYANEHLQYYFNQHIFKFEQEEYAREGIQWKNIEFIDNTGCLELFSKKPSGLFALLDEECNFPAATNETLLSKFHHNHSKRNKNVYYEAPKKQEMGFGILHYAGKVKYLVKDFREKNSDLIRTDIVANLKSSSLSFVRELMGVDPVAVARWTIVKALLKSMFAFIKAGVKYRQRGGPDATVLAKRKQSSNNLNIPEVLHSSNSFLSRRQSPTTPTDQAPPPPENRYSRHLVTGDGEDEVFLRTPRRTSQVVSPRMSAVSPRVSGDLRSPVDPYLSPDEAEVMRRATRVMMKNKSFKPKSRPQTMFSDIKTLKAIASRTMFGGGKINTKKQPPTVSAQFQWSLSRLMATLNLANPFFIRCIKSNADKAACSFDDVLVLRQLRYTGMLATVRIRQSGYNYRLMFEEFIQIYKILLPHGLDSTAADVKEFLEQISRNRDNFQIGINKVFLREGEKQYLDESLHCAIMKRVIAIQRFVKTKVEQKNFLQTRENIIIVQKMVRRFLVRRRFQIKIFAIMLLQRWFRGEIQRRKYHLVRHSAIRIQAHTRGGRSRARLKQLRQEVEERRRIEEDERERLRYLEDERLRYLEDERLRYLEDERLRQLEDESLRRSEDMHSLTSDEGVLVKDNSADELEIHISVTLDRRESEGSSGILDDSESDTLSEMKTPPPTPPSPTIVVQPLPPHREPGTGIVTKSPSGSRIQDLAKAFQSPDSRQDDTDGLSPSGTIFIRRGSARKRPPRISTAPLAKQESFSDLVDGRLYAESPGVSEKGSPLSPEQLKMIENTLQRRHVVIGSDDPTSSLEDIHSRSPFKRVKHLLVPQISHPVRETKSFPFETSGTHPRKFSITGNLLRRTKSSVKLLRISGGGRKKKDSSAGDESEDELEGNIHSSAKRPIHALGVSVLPPHPNRPTSPLLPKGDISDDEHHVEKRQQRVKKQRHSRKADKDKENRPLGDKDPARGWNVAGTGLWQYPDDWIITEVYEMQLLDNFINRKRTSLVNVVQTESQFEKVFNKCLCSFQRELKTTLSVVMQKGGVCNIKYRDLFANFEQTMRATCAEEKVDETFPITMAINAFRGYLDEFRNVVNNKKKDKKLNKKPYRHKREKLKKEAFIEHLGHKYSQVQFGIPTFCELCSNIIWPMEKGHVCQICKFTCHKRCIYKSYTSCKGTLETQKHISGTKVFGVPLANLLHEDEKIPVFMENLITTIELHGLYTEGIYRKGGLQHKIKLLRVGLDSGQIDPNVEDFPVHVLTTTLKNVFRDLPEPLLTFDLYDEFMQASEIKDDKEIAQVLYSLIARLPKVNHDILERLIFHLARVASHESSNKMSVNGLAIIFAPCLLRTSRVVQAQELLTQVSKQTICIEKILGEQLYNLRTKLQDISTLESAEKTAEDRLTVVRASMRNNTTHKTLVSSTPKYKAPASMSEDPENLDEQERALNSHVQSLRKEMDDLTSTLPVLEYRHSSDDDMLSADDVESVYDTADDMEYGQEEPVSSFDIPAEPATQLSHLTRQRELGPPKRLWTHRRAASDTQQQQHQWPRSGDLRGDPCDHVSNIPDSSVLTHPAEADTRDSPIFRTHPAEADTRDSPIIRTHPAEADTRDSPITPTQSDYDRKKFLRLKGSSHFSLPSVADALKVYSHSEKPVCSNTNTRRQTIELTQPRPLNASPRASRHELSVSPRASYVESNVSPRHSYTERRPRLFKSISIDQPGAERISSYENTHYFVYGMHGDEVEEDDDDEIMV